MSSKITALTALASVQADDVLPIVDVHDTTMASSGTTKKITLAQLLQSLPAASGDTTGATDTPALQAVLTGARTAGGGTVRACPGAVYYTNAPLRIGSNTTLDMTGATLSLVSFSACNMLQSWAVQANTRVVDAVINSTTTLTSATAAFTAGNAGNVLRVYYQDGTWLDTTIAAYVSATQVTLAAAAAHSQTGLTCYFGAGRDTGIRVLGGTWLRQANNATGGQNGWDSNSIRIRHCDGLEVGRVTLTNLSGKYAVNPGDCTDFYIHDIATPSAASDTVHINGPALNGQVERIYGLNSADDIVSMTCADFHGVSQWEGDTMGNITDIAVRDVYAAQPAQAGTARAVLIQAGQSSSNHGFTIDRIRVTGVYCSLNNYPVDITPDTDVYTQGGTYGRIVVDGVTNTASSPPGGAVAVRSPVTVTDLEVRNAADIGAATYLWVETGAAVTRLVAYGIEEGNISLQGTVTTARIIDDVMALAGTQTVTGTKTFTATPVLYGVTVKPAGGQGTSASVFMDNIEVTDQIWEFFCDNAGKFGIYDFTAGQQIVKIDAGAAANAIHVDNANIYFGTFFRCQAGAQFTNGIQYQHAGPKTGSYNISANSDYIVGVDPSGGAYTMTLPNVNWAGQVFIVKDETGHAATHNITVNSGGSLNIDGAASVAISANYGVLRVYSTGTGWSAW